MLGYNVVGVGATSSTVRLFATLANEAERPPLVTVRVDGRPRCSSRAGPSTSSPTTTS